MPEKTVEPSFITVAELAERLRIGRDAAYGLCRQEGFPAVRIGGLIRVPTAALTDWLENQTCSSTAALE